MDQELPELDPEVVRRKLARFFELQSLAQELALAGIRHQHPDASPEQVNEMFRERLAFGRKGKWGLP